jgi:hypothetical protein
LANGIPRTYLPTVKKGQRKSNNHSKHWLYPVTAWKALLTPAPVKGKFVDNGKHEFNAGLIQTVSPKDLEKL